MQPSNNNNTQQPQLPHQHSPKRSSPLSTAQPLTCDTTTARTPPPAPATPPLAHTAPPNPLTPPDSSSRSSASADPPAESPLPSLALPAAVTSTLSVSAPQFHSKLDAPIDIHQLAPRLALAAEGAAVDASVASPAAPAAVSVAASPAAPDFGHRSPAAAGPDAHAPQKTHPSAAAPEFVPSAAAPRPPQELRTPNVYINGLPPSFPEDQLYAMTREFGTVLSVRTFTRHVSDKPSGYGFVLFDSVDAAERCIETLKKYRNLHPSFSKQIHKIPGTPYASLGDAAGEGAPATRPTDSFKARMEQLQDMTSTNLYMEGLPLSIDEPTLSALVRPYRIMSSRFFQTRLSSPPRIIAFVRLETRVAAEEIIERLHGRMVRGWQDTGCRISVRFADTSEQRELRRMERCTPEDEQSPARITMAQAALLNLKGTQLHPDSPASPSFGSFPDVNTGVGLASDGYTLGQTAGSVPPLSRVNEALQFQQRQQLLRQSIDDLQDPAMALDAYGDFSANGAFIGQGLRNGQNISDEDLLRLDAEAELQAVMGAGMLDMSGMVKRADDGYTPMERLILQAHAQRQQTQLLNAQRERLAAQVQPRGLSDLRSSSNATNKGGSGAPGFATALEVHRRLLDVLPSMSEDDFHASAAGARQAFAHLTGGRDVGAGRSGLDRVAIEQSPGLARDFDQLSLSQQQQQHQRYQTHASQARAEAEAQAQALHTRSTTLPSRYLSNRDGFPSSLRRSVYSNNSSTISNNNESNMNMNRHANSSNNIIGHLSKQSQYTSTNALRNNNNDSISISNIAPRDGGRIIGQNVNNLFSSKNNVNIRNTRVGGTHTNKLGTIPLRHSSHEADDEDGGSPLLLSPALTYSARTPASMSPATPFSGFFPNNGETFEGPAMGEIGGGNSKGEVLLDEKIARQ